MTENGLSKFNCHFINWCYILIHILSNINYFPSVVKIISRYLVPRILELVFLTSPMSLGTWGWKSGLTSPRRLPSTPTPTPRNQICFRHCHGICLTAGSWSFFSRLLTVRAVFPREHERARVDMDEKELALKSAKPMSRPNPFPKRLSSLSLPDVEWYTDWQQSQHSRAEGFNEAKLTYSTTWVPSNKYDGTASIQTEQQLSHCSSWWPVVKTEQSKQKIICFSDSYELLVTKNIIIISLKDVRFLCPIKELYNSRL